MEQNSRLLAWCGMVVIAALVLGVGIVSHGVLRHIVQTAPMWIVIVLALRGSGYAKWAALPCFAFWLLIMIAIWLFLLGIARIVSGTFTPIEIAMTIVVGIASLAAIAKALAIRSGVRALPAFVTLLLLACLQLASFRLSLVPSIAHR